MAEIITISEQTVWKYNILLFNILMERHVALNDFTHQAARISIDKTAL